MRTLFAIVVAYFLVAPSGRSNPFSCKIKPTIATNQEIPLEPLYYKGYAIIDDKRFAFIQLGEKQFSAGKGDRIGKISIIDISANYVLYKIGGKTFKAVIDKSKTD